MSSSTKRRSNYAARAEGPSLMVRMNEAERDALMRKAELAGIPPRAGSLDDPNLSEAVRRAIEAWEPAAAIVPSAPPTDPSKKLRRVFVRG